MPQVYVARQPIFDAARRVRFYELLYRRGSGEAAGFDDEDETTAELLAATMVEIGVERIARHKKLFVTLSRNYLLGHWPIPVDASLLGICIPAALARDPEVVEAASRWRRQGVALTLDAALYTPELEPMLALVQYVKLDAAILEAQQLGAQVAALRRFDVRLVATRVETQRCYELYRQLRFDLFQGYFFARPQLLKGRQLPTHQSNLLRVLGEVQNPGVSIAQLELLIRRDVALSVKLLRYINSAFFGMPRRFESIREVIIYLGLKQLRVWVSLVLMSGAAGQPPELSRLSLMRAKSCELLAAAYPGGAEPAACFMAGLFSTLDGLFQSSLEQILAGLPLSEELTAALLRHEGPIGEVLAFVLAHEREPGAGADGLCLSAEAVNGCYATALAWADDTMAALT